MSNTNKKYNEDILVFPTARLYELGIGEGHTMIFNCSDEFKQLFSEDSRFQFLDRNLAETDPSFKQIIPYVQVYTKAKTLTAARSKKVGESRLVGLRSVGYGGHVNTADVDGETNLEPLALFIKGLVREINEELSFKDGVIPKWQIWGFINDNSNEVGKVHFGIEIGIYVESEDDVKIIDEGLIDHQWMSDSELKARREEFEGWSQLVIDLLEED